MKRYLLLITPLILIFTMVLSSCSLEEMSRDSELNAAAETTYGTILPGYGVPQIMGQ